MVPPPIILIKLRWQSDSERVKDFVNFRLVEDNRHLLGRRKLLTVLCSSYLVNAVSSDHALATITEVRNLLACLPSFVRT